MEFIVGLDVETWRLILLGVLAVFLMASLLSGYPVAFTLGGASVLVALVGSTMFVLDVQNPPWGVDPDNLPDDFVASDYLPSVFDPKDLTGIFQQVFGVMQSKTLLAVPLFVFMGLVLERSKIAEELLSTMGRLFAFMPGGLAISVCIVGALLAASTGIVGATVVTMGLLSLPTMLRAGYNKELATGTIAASGTLGQLIPPSIVLIILSDQLQSAYDKAARDPDYPCERLGTWAGAPCDASTLQFFNTSDLFMGALIPGLVLVGMYIIYVMIVALLNPKAAPAARAAGEPDPTLARDVLVALVPPLLLIVAVLGSILFGIATPTEAAGLGAMVAMLIAAVKLLPPGVPRAIVFTGLVSLAVAVALNSFGNGTDMFTVVVKKINDPLDQTMFWVIVGLLFIVGAALVVTIGYLFFAKATDLDGVESKNPILVDVLTGTLKVTAMVFIILVGARALTTVFVGLGGDSLVKDFLLSLQGGFLVQLAVVMLVMFILGFFLDFIEISFIVVPIVAPILLLGTLYGEPISPVWLGVVMAMNLQTSFLTPPFGFALFYLRGVAPPEIKTGDIYRGVVPYVFIQLIGLGVLVAVPTLVTWLPDALAAMQR